MLNEEGKSKLKPDLEDWCWSWPLRGTAWIQPDWTSIQPDLPEMESDWIRCCRLDQPHFPQKTLCLPSLACTAPAGQGYQKSKEPKSFKIFDQKRIDLTL